MNLTNLLGARLGLEEISEDLSPDYNPADVTDTTMLEMEKAHEEVVSTEADMAMLSDTTDSLERIAAVLESITTPTLSTESAMLINLAFENTMHPMAKYSDNKYSSALRGGDDPKEQSKSFKEKVKAAWAAFVLMLKKIWDAVTNFVSRLFSSASMLKRKAEAVLKKARSIRNNPNAPAFTMNVNEIQIDGKVPDGSLIVKHAKNGGEVYHDLLVGKSSLLSRSFVDGLEKVIIGIGVGVDAEFTASKFKINLDFGTFREKDVEAVRSYLKDSVGKLAVAAGVGKEPTGELAKSLGTDLTVKISKETLPGDRVVTFSVMNTEKLDKNNHSDFLKYIKSFNFDIVHNKEQLLERAEVKPLEIKELVDLLSTAINTCTDVEVFNKEWFQWVEANRKLQRSLSTQIEMFVTKVYTVQADNDAPDAPGGGKSLHQMDAGKAIQSFHMAILSLCSKFGSFEAKVAKQAMRNTHAIINYAGRSLNAHIGNPNDDFEAGPNATKNTNGYQEHERSTPGSKGFTNSRDDISDADLVV